VRAGVPNSTRCWSALTVRVSKAVDAFDILWDFVPVRR
jgi:hypothetical protein